MSVHRAIEWLELERTFEIMCVGNMPALLPARFIKVFEPVEIILFSLTEEPRNKLHAGVAAWVQMCMVLNLLGVPG